MTFNDLLDKEAIDPKQVLVLRHRPFEPGLFRILPWLAAEKPAVFNAYQEFQGPSLEGVMKKMEGEGYIASFIGQEAGKATFVGAYKIGGSKRLTRKQYWALPANREMQSFGMRGFHEEDPRSSILRFDLTLTSQFADWKGKLVIGWPPPERSWWRRAHRNKFPILAIHENSVFDAVMSEWDEIVVTWEQLRVLPTSWKTALSQWRGIYYIRDMSDGKCYVGSAYGKSNLLGRWLQYAASGHGGNRLLKKRDATNFQFSILQRVSPDLEAAEVVALENSWKERLHTRAPDGLNDN